MQDEYWDIFMSTGRVEDYLLYSDHRQGAGKEQYGQPCQAGEDPHAGIYMCNRNHTETDAYRGI